MHFMVGVAVILMAFALLAEQKGIMAAIGLAIVGLIFASC